MYSYEDRIQAVRLYLKLGRRIRATIRQLGYLTKNSLRAWHREYEQCHDLRIGYNPIPDHVGYPVRLQKAKARLQAKQSFAQRQAANQPARSNANFPVDWAERWHASCWPVRGDGRDLGHANWIDASTGGSWPG
ncbi:hypothetical protein LMG28727_07557 [Paraburkholderia kirstenboschensis]|nr:hypothetical protein LMG28727_07557 [Paraburkholderia kirstenboschensis]